MCLFRKILAGQVKDRPGSNEPGFLLFIIDDTTILLYNLYNKKVVRGMIYGFYKCSIKEFKRIKTFKAK